MYKFIAIDIDGTLLNSAGELTKYTKDTIKKVTSMGVKVVLTSGRVTDSVRGIASELNTDRHIICDNGATIVDLDTSEVVFSKYIDKSTIIKLVDFCVTNNIYYMVFTNKEIIVKDLKHMALAFYKQRHHLKDEATGMSQIKFAGIDYIQKIKEPFTRIIICDEDRAIYNSIVNMLKNFDDIELLSSPHVSHKIIKDGDKDIVLSYSYAEILAKDTNKWTAIKSLTDKLGIKKDEIIAIGDNFNDLEMIQNAGLGIAMNNGSPIAKQAARVIAPSNNEDGVAKIMERYVLKADGDGAV